MIRDYHEDVWATEAQCVRIYPDDDCADLWDSYDHLGVIASLDDRHRSTDDEVERNVRWAVQNGETYGEVVQHLKDDGATVVLFLDRVYDGGYRVAEVDPTATFRYIHGAVAMDTPKGRGEWGVPLDKARECLLAEVEEYSAWARGDVWVAVLEKRVTWTADDEEREPRVTWEIEDSVGWLVGRDYAVEAAADHFPKPDTTTTTTTTEETA